MGEARSLDFASIRAAAAIRDQVHPELPLTKKEGTASISRKDMFSAALFTLTSSLMDGHAFIWTSIYLGSPAALLPLRLTLGASMAVYVAPGGTW